MPHRFKAAAAAGMLALAIALPAGAGPVVLDATVGGAPTGMIYADFDDLALGAAGGVSGGIAVSFVPDARAVQGTDSLHAAPFLSNSNGLPFGDPTNGADATTYLTSGSAAAFADAGVTLIFPNPVTYMGLLWGSVDLYNTLGFYDASDNFLGSITGGNVTAAASGDQGVNGTYYVNIVSDVAFTRVVASSSGYAFEFDNVAYNPPRAVHEPMTLALLGAGLLGIGLARRRRGRGA